jgi:hypothetical protein
MSRDPADVTLDRANAIQRIDAPQPHPPPVRLRRRTAIADEIEKYASGTSATGRAEAGAETPAARAVRLLGGRS